MDFNQIKQMSEYAECLANSKKDNLGACSEFHEYNAMSEVAYRMSMDYAALSDNLLSLACDYSDECQDSDLEPDQFGGSQVQ